MILDANVVVALLDRRDAHHETAAALMLDAAGERCSVPPVTLAEGLIRHTRAGAGAAALAHVGALRIEVETTPVEPLALASLRATTGLKMPDCIVLHAAEATGRPLATLDDRLARVARERGVTVRPA